MTALKGCESCWREVIEPRLLNIEKEQRHIRNNMLSEDKAQSIFRAEVVKTNARTRLAVAVIAAIALIGNGAQNALANHDAMSLQMRCEQGAAKAVEKADQHAIIERHAIADEAARNAVRMRDQQIDVLKGTQ